MGILFPILLSDFAEAPCLKMSSEEMEKAMGFSSFSSNKTAKKFDFMEMFNESRNIAKQRNEEGNKKLDGKFSFINI